MNEMEETKVCCPACGSQQIHANQRGWSLVTGFIGSGKVVITCLACGKRFRPGEPKHVPVDYKPLSQVELDAEVNGDPSNIIIGIVFVIFILLCLGALLMK